MNIGILILSIFCLGGIVAYGRQALRLRRLIAAGVVTTATVRDKQKDDAGSESVVHYLITYEFSDGAGNAIIHEQDMNSLRFFDGIAVGDEIRILYQPGDSANSYPLDETERDLRIAKWMVAGLVLLWAVMGMVLVMLDGAK